MHTIKRILSVLLIGGAGLGLFVACGTPAAKEGCNTDADCSAVGTTCEDGLCVTPANCTFDADCEIDEACEAQACVGTCASSADCRAGEECGIGVNTELNVCKAGQTNNISPNVINPNSNTNNIAPNISNLQLYYSIRIQSTTFGDAACADVTDPGPDIFGVGLEDSTGAKLGFGTVVWEEVQFEGNDQTDTSVLDSNGPDLAADSCPDMFDGNVVSLGCGALSYIIVSFSDSDAQPIPLDATADQFVRVYEWGGQCTTGSVDDTYNVDICTDKAGAESGDDSSCIIQVIIDGAGEASGEIAGF